MGGSAPQLSGQGGRREHARDGRRHLTPPFAQPTCTGRTAEGCHTTSGPGNWFSARRAPDGQITIKLATISPRLVRPDHHELCDQITTTMPETMASPDAM